MQDLDSSYALKGNPRRITEQSIAPGDLLVLFTDGISDAESPERQDFGEQAIKEAVASSKDLTPEEIVEIVLSAADAFAAGAPQHDDMTVVVAKVQ